MGRTLETLKHSNAGPVALKVASQLPANSTTAILPLSNSQDEIPFIEVGGPPQILIGGGMKMTPRDRGPRIDESRSKTESMKSNIGLTADPQLATIDFLSIIAPHSLSVAFHSLGSLHSIETATGLIASDVAVFHQPDSLASQEFRAVAAGIQQQLAAGGTHLLFFASASPRAGTTTTVLNLGTTWARYEKRKVLVVDAADARAAVAVKMGLSNTPGLSDVLRGTVPLAQALQETKQANCWILAAGELASESNVTPEPKAVRDLLRQARKQFDLVLLDALPWNDESATITMASGADAVYLVLRQSETKTPKVDEVIRRIQRHDIFLGGCVITHRMNM